MADFIRDFKRENTQVLVDPTMGDHGHLYSVCDEDLIEAMRELMQYADVVTPNLTEACALTDTLYQENGWSKRKLSDLTWKLHLLGARSVILTGVVKGKTGPQRDPSSAGKDPVFHATKFVAGNYHGTGDVFAAVIVPAWCEVCRWRKPSDGRQLLQKKCVEKTEELGAPEQDGLCLEACLSYLTKLS